jgi:hypothetical protein
VKSIYKSTLALWDQYKYQKKPFETIVKEFSSPEYSTAMKRPNDFLAGISLIPYSFILFLFGLSLI